MQDDGHRPELLVDCIALQVIGIPTGHLTYVYFNGMYFSSRMVTGESYPILNLETGQGVVVHATNFALDFQVNTFILACDRRYLARLPDEKMVPRWK